MLRRAGISVRLYLLSGIIAVAVLGLVTVVYSAVGGQVDTQRQLVALASAQAAAQTSQYDFADFNGWHRLRLRRRPPGCLGGQ